MVLILTSWKKKNEVGCLPLALQRKGVFYYMWTAFFGKKLHHSYTVCKEAKMQVRPNATQRNPYWDPFIHLS